jgi:hypothetical protein
MNVYIYICYLYFLQLWTSKTTVSSYSETEIGINNSLIARLAYVLFLHMQRPVKL